MKYIGAAKSMDASYRLGIVEAGEKRRLQYATYINRAVERGLGSEKTKAEIKRLVHERIQARIQRIVEASADRIMRETEDARLPSGPPIKDILKAVSSVSGKSVGDLIGPSRFKQLARARHMAFHLLRVLRPDLSSTAIGVVMHKDHSTILSGLKMFARRQNFPPLEGWMQDAVIKSLMSQSNLTLPGADCDAPAADTAPNSDGGGGT